MSNSSFKELSRPSTEAPWASHMITLYFDGCAVDITRWVRSMVNIAEGVWDTILGPCCINRAEDFVMNGCI